MANVIITREAHEDSAEIYDYLLAEAGLVTAEKYMQYFTVLYKELSDYPEAYQRRPEITRETRAGVVSPYLVLYRYIEADEIVLIQRIIHGSRRITRKILRKAK
jgi:toxin ParE1/3/4